jgi:pyrroloquinoline quinone biosynthesis protein E
MDAPVDRPDSPAKAVTAGPPASLLAELTHRCPLHCLYCSNPLELVRRERELSTDQWIRVLREASALGVLQVHLSGGEPLLRPDLVALVEGAAALGLYANLITSGLGLTRGRAQALRDAGLGSVQLSVQAADAAGSRSIAGGEFWRPKMDAAGRVREAGLSLSLNVVLHRHNLPQVAQLLELAAALGAERIELANAQYYGWALRNRDYLLPDKDMLEEAEAAVDRFRRRAGRTMDIVWVIPDYHAPFPKPCMNGWARTFMTVAPDGTALPCPAASVIPGLSPPSVRAHSLRWIWYESPAFNRFRGVDWMPEPCRSCPRRFDDFGGCRCQAYLLAGDAAATDPVCTYSPHHHIVAQAAAGAGSAAAAPAYRGRA